MKIDVPDGYEVIALELMHALEQASAGKGEDRHGARTSGEPIVFADQQIMRNARITGPNGPAFQVLKKVEEGLLLHARGEALAAHAEIIGAIIYLAAVAHGVRPVPIKNTRG